LKSAFTQTPLVAMIAAAVTLCFAATASAGELRGFDHASSTYDDATLVVGFDKNTSAEDGRASIAGAAAGVSAGGPRSAVVKVREGESLRSAARRIARRSGVSWVKPNYVARTADNFLPNDPGIGSPGDWRSVQWNFVGDYGVNILPAWGRMRDLGKEGGAGAVVAVIDTGVAYQTVGRYRVSPDLVGVKIVKPYDFVDRDRRANDRNGHGTHVASTIFEQTNNGVGLTGLAYGASLMPLKALDRRGLGDEVSVARAIRYAARNKADVINLSVEFDVRLSARDLPSIISAMRYARQKGSLVVAAAGNQQARKVAYPARSNYALAVGATTINGCLADYSDVGNGLDLVAPGGGADALIIDGRAGSSDRNNCRSSNPAAPIVQMTFGRSPKRFGLPTNYQGTSMAAPHVAGAAALVVASGIIGPDPTPAAITERLQATATDVGFPGYDTRYGWGIVNAGNAVTAP
jgi:serine protease